MSRTAPERVESLGQLLEVDARSRALASQILTEV